MKKIGGSIVSVKRNMKTESEASFILFHVISKLTTQALNRGFIWHARLFSTQAPKPQFKCPITTMKLKWENLFCKSN